MASIRTTTGSKSAMGTVRKSGANQVKMSRMNRVGPSNKNVKATRNAQGKPVPTAMIGRSLSGPDLGDG
jgi:hypothetical protein